MNKIPDMIVIHSPLRQLMNAEFFRNFFPIKFAQHLKVAPRLWLVKISRKKNAWLHLNLTLPYLSS